LKRNAFAVTSLGRGMVGGQSRVERAVQHRAAQASVAADVVIDAVIAAPDDWWQWVGGVAADDAVEIAEADVEPSPSPPATRSAMRAAVVAVAQLRVSSV
jgi:hypothetical protein